MTAVSLSIPDLLHSVARDIVTREEISFEQFVTLAIAEKASAIATEEYLRERAQRGSREKFLAAMGKVADVEPADERDRI